MRKGFSLERSIVRLACSFGPKLSSVAVALPSVAGVPSAPSTVTVNVAFSPQRYRQSGLSAAIWNSCGFALRARASASVCGVQTSEGFMSSSLIAQSQRERSLGFGSKLFVPKENFAPIDLARRRNFSDGNFDSAWTSIAMPRATALEMIAFMRFSVHSLSYIGASGAGR